MHLNVLSAVKVVHCNLYLPTVFAWTQLECTCLPSATRHITSMEYFNDDEDNIHTIFAIACLVKALKIKKRRGRKIWAKEWLLRRNLPGRGTLSLVHNELRLEDPVMYKNFLRMNDTTFDKLLGLIDEKISRTDTNMRQCIPSLHRLSLTLRFLANGETYQNLEILTRISASTISLIIPEVCVAIYEVLKKDYLKVPSTNAEWEKIAKEFEDRWNYPNCLGAMDGKHVEFRAPKSAGSVFFNYKDKHSIVLLALVDADYKFTYIDVGTNGRISDGGVFRESDLATALSKNSLNIPVDVPLPQRATCVPYVIVADDAFPLSDRIMKPYPNRGLTREQRIFNYRLSRARRISENAFGIIANRFRILLAPINLSSEKVKIIVLAICALHNFIRVECSQRYVPPCFVDSESDDGVIVPGNWRTRNQIQLQGLRQQQAGNRAARTPIMIRDEFKEFFSNEGKVPWQDHHIFG